MKFVLHQLGFSFCGVLLYRNSIVLWVWEDFANRGRISRCYSKTFLQFPSLCGRKEESLQMKIVTTEGDGKIIEEKERKNYI